MDRNYGGVVLVAAAAVPVHLYMTYRVIAARTKYGVKPPIMYVPEDKPTANGDASAAAPSSGTDYTANIFNCVQRAHQNSLENFPMFLIGLLLGGLKHPIAATAVGAFYIISRLVYFIGYASGRPQRRMLGLFSGLFAILALDGLAIASGVQIALSARSPANSVKIEL